ncbi:MAG: calcium-binding protein [Marinibacterium sp.]
MTTALSYQADVDALQSDFDFLGNTSTAFGFALTGTEKWLKLPGQIEDSLDQGANLLDLPAPVVAALGVAPYGIGTAIKTLDKIGDATADQIRLQADIMGALDKAWAPTRTSVDTAKNVNTKAGTVISAVSGYHTQRVNEADWLAKSLGDQDIYAGSQLAARMDGYSMSVQSWFAVRSAVLKPLEDAVDAIEAATSALASIMPDVSVFDDALAVVSTVFQPLADAAKALENALCVVFTVTPAITVPPVTITPAVKNPFTGEIIIPAVVIPGFTIPAVTVDICGILATIDNALGVVQDFVLDTINSILATLGIDLTGAINTLQAELLKPLQPIFNLIDTVEKSAQAVVDQLANAVDGITDDWVAINDSLAQVEATLALQPTIFANIIVGDQNTDPDDILVGTAGEDGIFGLAGDDTITVGAGDFGFGGAGSDTLNSAGGGNESYGGFGADTLNGDDKRNLLDGGQGFDTLIGGGGNDVLIGGAGVDTLEGGTGADDFVFMTGDGLDIIRDFENDIDEILLDQALAGGLTAQELVDQKGGTFLGFTFIAMGSDILAIRGVTPDELVDDLVFI